MVSQEELKIFIEDLEETILRLHVQLRGWEEEYDQFKKQPILKDRENFKKAFRQYVYYHGKFYAYYFVLDKLGSDVPKILQRLRGIEIINNTAWELKAHYSEIFGHFPTNQSNQYFKNVKSK